MTSRGAYMQCKYCEKNTVFNTAVCDRHGGHKIRYGKDAPHFKTGQYTQEAMETRRRLRLLHHLGNLGGFIKRKLRGRKILINGEWI